METIYFITDIKNTDTPMHIKINSNYGGAVLGFSSMQVANFYIEKMGIPNNYRAVSNTEINTKEISCKNRLLVFKSVTEIENAYANRANTDWGQYLHAWPK